MAPLHNQNPEIALRCYASSLRFLHFIWHGHGVPRLLIPVTTDEFQC